LREREEQLNQRRQQLMAELEEQRLALAAEERDFQELYNASRATSVSKGSKIFGKKG